MLKFLFILFLFPKKSISVTLYTQRFGLTDHAVSSSTSNDCLLPNTTFHFHTLYNFTINNCKANKCYAILDKASQLKYGNINGMNPSSFSSVTISGARFLQKGAGIIFKPSQSTVNLLLQTRTCHDFYTIHPFENTENCNSSIPISNIIQGLPFCRDID